MTRTRTTAARLTLILTLTLAPWTQVGAQRGDGPGPGAAPVTPRSAAPIDLTGSWVSVVTEDWRYRMVTPARGDYQGVPMTPEAVEIAEAWNPEADEASGEQCRSYGAAAIMRVPGRLNVTWQGDDTLRLETDAGMQTRLFRFGPGAGPGGSPTWQGDSNAEWQGPGGGRRGAALSNGPGTGTLKVITRNMRAGYLRKNGVPYSENAVLTEYFNLARRPDGDEWLVVVAVVEDSQYLRQPFVVSTHFRKQADGTGWDPTPCSATW